MRFLLTFILVITLVACTSLKELSVTPTVARVSTPAIADEPKPNCDFLRQTRAREVLNQYQQYTSLEVAVTSNYEINASHVHSCASSDNPNGISTMDWLIEDPYFGTVNHGIRLEDKLPVALFVSVPEPVPLKLTDLIKCRGGPDSYA